MDPSGRTRVDIRTARSALAALVICLLIVAIGLIGPHPISPTPAPSASRRLGSPSSDGPLKYAAGQLLRAIAPVPVGSWDIGVGQPLYVVGHVDGPNGAYRIQHFGDIETGYRPDGVIGTISAPIVEERTVAYQAECPRQVSRVEQVAWLTPFERLACFARAEITIGPVRRDRFEVLPDNPLWLTGEAGLDFLTAIPYRLEGSVEFPSGHWFRVRGHYDDTTCAGELRCRERFTVSHVDRTTPPDIELAGTWSRVAKAPIAGRSSYVAIETDRGTFIWGGSAESAGTAGAIYDAGTDRWTKITSAPGVDRPGAAAAWSGRLVLIWGGAGSLRDGLAYDPAIDRWSTIPDAPIAGDEAIAAWTGSEFIVASSNAQATAWDPSARSWRRLPDPPIPAGYLEGVWTGHDLVVLGLGKGDAEPVIGARLDPATSRWRRIADPPTPGSSWVRPPGGPARSSSSCDTPMTLLRIDGGDWGRAAAIPTSFPTACGPGGGS